MIDLDKYQQLRKRADKAKSDAERAEGALEQHMARLKADFNCETVEQAESMLKDLERQEHEAKESYNRALADFETKWGKLL